MPEGKAHPLNVTGPFYVEDGCCLICDLPRTLAPDMFKYDDTGRHCYVYKQPETKDQVTRMLEAVASAEVACIRCRGQDPQLLRLLEAKGLKAQCDVFENKA